MMGSEFLHRFCSNGWKIETSEIDDCSRYSLVVLFQYDVKCYANVCEYRQQLCLNGHYGVAWIDCTYENEEPYSISDLEDMINGITLAEDNLLRCGIPFTPDFEFHGRNKANKKRRNEKIRRELNLEKIEIEDLEQEV